MKQDVKAFLGAMMMAPRPHPGRHLPASKLHSRASERRITRDFKFPFRSFTSNPTCTQIDLAINRHHQFADGAHKVLLAALLELDLGYFKADTHH